MVEFALLQLLPTLLLSFLAFCLSSFGAWSLSQCGLYLALALASPWVRVSGWLDYIRRSPEILRAATVSTGGLGAVEVVTATVAFSAFVFLAGQLRSSEVVYDYCTPLSLRKMDSLEMMDED